MPAELGGTAAPAPEVGSGGVAGRLITGPPRFIRRMSTFEISWQGADGGVDRPLANPFLVLQRRSEGQWRAQDSDLGIAFMWREAGGRYTARYEIGPNLPLGRYRLQVRSGDYDLTTPEFRVAPSVELRILGATIAGRGDSARVVIHAQNPPPDPDVSVIWRPRFPRGGRALLRLGGQIVEAAFDPATSGWTAALPRGSSKNDRFRVLRLRDAAGNTAPPGTFAIGRLAPVRWPANIGVGGGPTPGPFGRGYFLP